MAFGKTPIEVVLNEGTLAAGATLPATPGADSSNIIDLNIASQLALQCEATFHGSAVGDVVILLRASAVGGTLEGSWDTVDYTSIRLPCNAGARVQITKPIWPDPLYLTPMAVNEDGTYAATSVKVTKVAQEVEAT